MDFETFDSDLRPLDDRAVRNRCVLDDDDNAIANYEAKVLTVTFLHAILVKHPDITADARVLIDDRSLNDCGSQSPSIEHYRSQSRFQCAIEFLSPSALPYIP
ncbi:MAG: hypothetical protein K0Q83_3021 [Deltaproteobacteria bacterium]|nr:hypothetical protein [Deltaproteobacteria bacterium]